MKTENWFYLVDEELPSSLGAFYHDLDVENLHNELKET